MNIDPLVLATIAGMGLVTYFTRVGGMWLIGRVRQTPRVEAWLRHIPGAVLVSLTVPIVAEGGPADALAVVATALVALRTRNFLLSIVVGVLAAWILRQLMPATWGFMGTNQ
jgi:uncharacterized membrane protein